jgi:hypothetical protein
MMTSRKNVGTDGSPREDVFDAAGSAQKDGHSASSVLMIEWQRESMLKLLPNIGRRKRLKGVASDAELGSLRWVM